MQNILTNISDSEAVLGHHRVSHSAWDVLLTEDHLKTALTTSPLPKKRKSTDLEGWRSISYSD